MPNVRVIDRYAKLTDVKISELRAQCKGNGRPRKASVITLCDLVENFLAEWEKVGWENGS